MTKNNRGKRLNKLPAKGKGDCPLCYRKHIKLLYDNKTATNETIQVCKFCRER